MKCRRARTEIALWVGSDLDESAEHQLRQHLNQCPHCREHWRQMKVSLRMLQNAERRSAVAISPSVWPGLASRLIGRQAELRMNRFNGWVAAVAVVASALAMVSVSQSLPSGQPGMTWEPNRSMMPGAGIRRGQTLLPFDEEQYNDAGVGEPFGPPAILDVSSSYPMRESPPWASRPHARKNAAPGPERKSAHKK